MCSILFYVGACGCVPSFVHVVVPLTGSLAVAPSSYLTAHGILVLPSSCAIMLVASTSYAHHYATSCPPCWEYVHWNTETRLVIMHWTLSHRPKHDQDSWLRLAHSTCA
ncbi:hypothetical protein DE146DRAFT_652940 [Phaeosphaeria sp. MPI-PUGE-AT-0046c]|nr:hypothetical protein DE146DRAFT_652940 [Phaeosphaeria sp. MPI-PUGE-AT-0046c]